MGVSGAPGVIPPKHAPAKAGSGYPPTAPAIIRRGGSRTALSPPVVPDQPIRALTYIAREQEMKRKPQPRIHHVPASSNDTSFFKVHRVIFKNSLKTAFSTSPVGSGQDIVKTRPLLLCKPRIQHVVPSISQRNPGRAEGRTAHPVIFAHTLPSARSGAGIHQPPRPSFVGAVRKPPSLRQSCPTTNQSLHTRRPRARNQTKATTRRTPRLPHRQNPRFSRVTG